MRTSRTALSAAVAMLAVVQGCTCPGDEPRDPTFGELRIRVDERVDSTAEFNFGTVAMGTTAAKKLVLINTGRASLTVTGYSKPDATQSPTSAGANVTICETQAAPLDGSNSTLDTCPTSLLFRWEEVGNPANFRDFSPDPTWPGQTPVTTTTYRVGCADSVLPPPPSY